MWDESYATRGNCRDFDPDALFVQGAEQNKVKVICRACPVRTECLADALDNRVNYGVWGGMTERERRVLLRRRSDVTSWRELLRHAREAYEREGHGGGTRPVLVAPTGSRDHDTGHDAPDELATATAA